MLESVLQLGSIQYDTLSDFLDSGGWVTRWILAACAVLMTAVLERAWYLWRIFPQARKATHVQWQARTERSSWEAQRIRTTLISQLRVGLEAGLPVIKVMVPMAPLLGLLGTVMGMLQVFDAMALSKSSDTRAMADGISHAMIATMTGLVVSVLGLFFSSFFAARVRVESERLNDLIATE